jgi:hypothetical protein
MAGRVPVYLTNTGLAQLRETGPRADRYVQQFNAMWTPATLDWVRPLSPEAYAALGLMKQRYNTLLQQTRDLPRQVFPSIAAATAAAAELNRHLEQLIIDITGLHNRFIGVIKQHLTERMTIRDVALRQLNDQIVAEIGADRWPQIREHPEYRPVRLRVVELTEPYQAMGRAWQERVFATPQEMKQEYDRIKARAEEIQQLLTQLQEIARRLLAAPAPAVAPRNNRPAAQPNNGLALINRLARRAAAAAVPAPRNNRRGAAAAAAAPAEACALRPVIHQPQLPDIVQLLRRFPNQTRYKLKDLYTDFDKILTDVPNTWDPYRRGPIPAYRYGLCPVCLTVHEEQPSIEGGGGCKYHYDSCHPDNRDEHLWDKYKYTNRYTGKEMVEFCFTCGRPCKGHGHYAAVAYNAPKGELLPLRQGDHFAYECAGGGGGDRKETIARILGIIEFFNSLDPAVPITIDKAFKTRMARVANAAALDVAKLRAGAELEPRAGRPFGKFPEIRGDLWVGSLPEEAAHEPVGWFIADRAPKCPTGPDGFLTHFPPRRIDEEGQCPICFDDKSPRYKFKHNNNAGVMYEHTDDQLICMSCIINHLIANLQNLIPPCFIGAEDDGSGCGGTLHPCEFQMIRDQPIPEDAAAPADIRNGEDLFQRLVKNARTAKLVLKGGKRRRTQRRKIQKKARKHTHKKLKRQLKR